MAPMRRFGIAVLSFAAVALASAQAPRSLPADLDRLLRSGDRFGATDLSALELGHVIARVDRGSIDTEVLVTAAIKIYSPRARTAQYFGQYTAYVDGQVTLGFGRFGRPPALADVKDLSLDRDEIAALRSCRPGDCDLRLGGAAIEAFRTRIDWNAADVDARVDALARQSAVDYVTAYLARGDEALVTYNDEGKPESLKEQWRALFAASPVFQQYSPALASYLASFPRGTLPGGRDIVYWIKENYGLKPVVTFVHAVVHDDPAQPDRTTIVQKQIFATRYFDASLAVTTVAGATENGRPVSYLLYVNRSRGDLLKGGFGGLRRSVADSQARKAAEQTLTAIKTALEKG
jgi:hypothetical protein